MILKRIASSLIRDLLLTIILEGTAAFVLRVRTLRGQITVLLANLVTNPVLNAILLIVSFYLSKDLYYVFLVPLEILAAAAEGLIYRNTLPDIKRPFILSLLLNLCSYGIGTLILNIFF